MLLISFLGIRGELHVIVKVEFFSDYNKHQQSGGGLQYFCSKLISSNWFMASFIIKSNCCMWCCPRVGNLGWLRGMVWGTRENADCLGISGYCL